MVRVRLRFDSTPLHYARQCWFLFDPDSCRLVGDVAYLIARRFGLQDTAGIQLYMDDCLIPSNESALILKDNDMLQVRTLPDEETSITYTDASTSPEKWKATPLKRQKLDHSKKRKRKKEKEKRERITKKTASPPPVETTKQTEKNNQQKQSSSLQQTSQAADFLSGIPPSLRRTPPVRVVTTQSAGGAIHTKFCSSSDSEPDELPSSVMAATHTDNTSTITSPLSKQPPPSGKSKGRKNQRTFPSVVGGPSDVHTTRSEVHQRPEEPLTHEQRLEEDASSRGETGTKEEEDEEPSGRVEPAPGTVRDYGALPDLHGAPRNGDQIAFKTLELSLPNYTPEVSEYKEAAVLGYDVSTKMVKLKLSEATLKQEMQKARKRANGRFTLMEELQEPLVDCQEMVELNLESLMNPKLIS